MNKLKKYLNSAFTVTLLALGLSAQAQTTYWDGASTSANSVIDGGSGTWNSATTNWTNSTGATQGIWPGTTSVATFGGAAGTVTVSGTQSIGGLRFLMSGYSLMGGTLTGASATNTITTNGGTNISIGSVLAGANAFAKAGAGALTLGGSNTYSGVTTVSGGQLIVTGTTGLGAVTVQTTASLGGSGTVKGATTVQSGGAYSPGNGVGTLTHNAALTLNSGSVSQFDLAQAGTPGGSCNDLSVVTGNLAINGAIAISKADGTSGCAGNFGAGQYVLFTATGTISGTVSSISLPSGFTGTVTFDNTSAPRRVLLNVTAATVSGNVYWDEATNTPANANNGTINGGTGTWSSATANWTDSNGTSNTTWPGSANVAVFDGTAGTVTLSGNQSIGGLTFNKAYSILGAGNSFLFANSDSTPITVASGITATLGSASVNAPLVSGSSAISKEGAGKLVVGFNGADGTNGNPLNNYSGTFTINAGTVDVGLSSSASPTYPTASKIKWVVNSGGTLRLLERNVHDAAAGLTVNGGTVQVINSYNLFNSPTFNNATIIANGGSPGISSFGTLALNGTVTATGISQVNVNTSGVIDVRTQHINIGTLNTSGSSVTFDVQSGGTFTINVPLRNNQDASAYPTDLIKVGSGSLILGGDASITSSNGLASYSGRTIINTGVLQIGTGGGYGDIGSTSDVSTASGASFIFNRNNAYTFNKVISGAGNVLQNGSGTTTFSGVANTYTGTTTVNAGTLVMGSGALDVTSSTVATAPIVVNSGATLRLARHNTWGAYTSVGHNNITVNAGTLASNSTTTTLTNLNLNSGTVTANGGQSATLGAFVFKGTVTSTGTSALTLGTGTNNTVMVGDNAAGSTTTFNVSSGTLTAGLPLVNNLDAGGTAVVSNIAKSGAGKMVLSVANTYTGTTTVAGGTLLVNGNNALATGSVTVQSGGTLGGIGTIGGATTVQSGGTYAPGQSPGTLTFSGDLILNSGSTTQYELAKAGTSSSDACNDLSVVGGNLTLSGNLSVTATTGASGCSSTFGPGTYRLFNVTGSISGTFSNVTVPAGYVGKVVIDTTTSPKQVNLMVLDGATLTYWDESANASANANNNTVNGGTGSWSGNANWTNNSGATNGAWPGNKTATFQGTAGAVSLTTAETMAGLTFNVDGYSITGAGSLTGSASTNSITVASGASASVGVTLAGSNAISKADGGTLVLSGTNTYTGSTTVSAGTLLVNGNQSAATGAVTIQSGAALGGAGTVGGATSVQSGASFSAGASTGIMPGTLNLSAGLSISSGSTVTFDLAQAGTPGGSCNDLGAVTGNLTLGGTLRINKADGVSGCASSFGAGTYTLFTYTGSLSGGFSSVRMPAGYLGVVDTTTQPNTVLLTVIAADFRYWDEAVNTPSNDSNGAVNGGTGNWDASDINWTSSTGAQNNVWAGPTKVAVFQANSGTVTLVGTQSASGLSFSSPTTGGNYTLTGGDFQPYSGSNNPLTVESGLSPTIASKFTGSTGVIKLGAGTLNLTGESTGYTGLFTVDAGSVFIGPAGGTATSQIPGAYTVNSGAALELGRSNTWALPTGTSSAKLTVAGGALKLTNAFNTLVDPEFNSATLTANGGSPSNTALGVLALKGTVLSSGTTLVQPSSSTQPWIHIGSGTAGGSTTFNVTDGTFTVGTPMVNAHNGSSSFSSGLLKSGAGTMVLTDSSTYTGSTTVSAGTLQIGSGSTTGDAATTSGFSVGSGATLAVNRSNAYSLANTVSGGGAFSQIGSGTTTLTGANSYTGTTTVSSGRLNINGNQSAATGDVNVASGAILGGTGQSGGAVTVQSGATLSPGVTVGTLALGSAGKTLTLATGSTTAFDLAQAGTPGGSCNDLVSTTGNLSLGGTLSVSATSGCGSTFGAGTYRLFNYTGSVSGSFSSISLPAGFIGRVDTSTAEQVNLIVDTTASATYWDGANTTGNNTVDGGTSTWDASITNWTTSTGSVNGSWPGSSAVAIFQGTAGTVTVSGTQSIGGLTFNTTDYKLSGSGTLTAAASTNTITVGTGLSAEIGSTLAGGSTNAIAKAGAGTLVITGTSTYTGATIVSAGTLQIGSGAGGGTSGDMGSTSGVSLSTGASLSMDRSDAYSFAKAISGAGSFTQSGSGTTTLGAVNTYSGGTTVSAGTLKAGVNNALPTGRAVTLAASTTLDVNSTTQSVSTLTAASGTLALGTNGQITLTSGTSTVGAITGTGKIVVSTGATLTLTQALADSGIAIELAGGTLNLGAGLTHTLGALTVTATGSKLDFASGGNAKVTFTSVDVSSGAALSVTNWTDGQDLFSVTAVVGSPARATSNVAPLNRITFSGYAATNTNWRTSQDEITPILPNPYLKVSVVSNGGTGSFNYNLSGLSVSTLNLTTATAGTAVNSAQLTGTTAQAATITQSNVPTNWSSSPASASCLDSLGASNGNGTASFGTLSGAVLTVPAAKMIAGADITCTFTNTLGTVITGKVFNDGGAPSGGTNSGTPNNGVQEGNEAGLSGVAVALTNCASTTYASSSTDATGSYSLTVPTAQNGQAVCVAVTLPTGYLATGANVGGTATPDGAATAVSAVSYTYSRSNQRQSFTAPASGTLALNFGQVPVSTWVSNSNQNAGPGTFATHSHRFTAGTGGSLALSTGTATSSPSTLTGWTSVVYLDSTCSGTLASGATPLTSSVTVTQGQVVCVVMREFVPAAALNGNSLSQPVQAQLTFTNASPTLSATYTVTDVTNVSNSAISLSKQVRNITTGGANASWSTGNEAKSGDVLEYQITFTNNIASPVTDLTIQDGTTAWTTWTSAGVGSVPSGLTCKLTTPANTTAVNCSPAVTGSGKGSLSWTFTGSLQPGASGTVTFLVTVD